MNKDFILFYLLVNITLPEHAWPEQLQGTPRAYFQRHVAQDPHFDCAGIRVAVDPDFPRFGGIVRSAVVMNSAPRYVCSCVRVFVRELRVGGTWTALGGIGEVATHPEFRGRGLATQLLDSAVQYMADKGCAACTHPYRRIPPPR